MTAIQQARLPGFDDLVSLTAPPATWSVAVEEYLTERATAGAAKLSLAAFRADLNLLAGMFPNRDPLSLTPKDARWALGQAGKRAATVARRHGTWRAFYRWTTERGWLNETPFRFGFEETPRSTQRAKGLTGKELAALQRAVKDDPVGEFVLRLFLDTGMKPSEAIQLRGVDLNLAENLVTVRGRRDRAVPVSGELQAAYRGYLEFCGLSEIPDAPVFPYTQRWLEKQLQRIAERAAVSCTAQTLRWHRAITDLRNGVSEERVRVKMGYSELSWQMHARPALLPWLPSPHEGK